jgi:hypothetical protein
MFPMHEKQDYKQANSVQLCAEGTVHHNYSLNGCKKIKFSFPNIGGGQAYLPQMLS